MSYDLMVFDPMDVPVDREAFLKWYSAATDWVDSKRYDDPSLATSQLQGWYAELSKEFPSLSQFEESTPEDEARFADYSIAANLIYVGFSWSTADRAYPLAKRLAAENFLGLFNVSSPSTEVYLPNAAGRLVPVTADFSEVEPYHFALWKRSPTTKTAMLAESYSAIQAGLIHEAMAPFDAAELDDLIRNEFEVARGATASALRTRTLRTTAADWLLVTTTPAALPEVRDFIVPLALDRSVMVYDPQAGAVWGNRRPPKPPKSSDVTKATKASLRERA